MHLEQCRCSRADVARTLFLALDRRLEELLEAGPLALNGAFLDGLGLRGQRVRLTLATGERSGVLTDLKPDGTLLVQSDRAGLAACKVAAPIEAIAAAHVTALRAFEEPRLRADEFSP